MKKISTAYNKRFMPYLYKELIQISEINILLK